MVEKYPSRDYQGLEQIVREFVQANPAKVETAAFGIAGAVRQGRVETTNLPWVVESATLTRELVYVL